MKKWKCTVCSYEISSEDLPEKCPVCGAQSSMIIEVKESAPVHEKTNLEEPAANEDAAPKAEQRQWKCTICNYIHNGPEPPEKCPVCGADSSYFIEVGAAKPAKAKDPEVVADPGAVEVAAGSQAETSFVGKMIVRHHLHPISVHTPNGVMPIAMLFLAGGMIFGFSSLELASLFNMIVVLLSMPLVFMTGYVAWRIKYKGASTYVFKVKFVCALVVAVLLTLMICWRLIQQDIAFVGTTASYIYFGLGVVILGAVGIAGHLGGKLVFDK